MSKTIFGQGTLLTPDVANAWQNPVFVSRADRLPSTTQFDLNDGEIFIPQITPSKDIVTSETSVNLVLSPDGNGGVAFRDLYTGSITIPPAGTIGTIGIPVTVNSGEIINTVGEVVTFPETLTEIEFSQTKYIYIEDDGTVRNESSLPSRVIPHTPLGKLTASGSAITEYIDLRPHSYVGAHNDTPLDLLNTETKVANYNAVSFDRVITDTSGGSFRIILPEFPKDGDRVAFVDLTGSFSSNPLILAPWRNVGVANYTISDSDEDWLFSANYTYVQLVYVEESNTWVFEAIPDTTCKNRGTFVRCGGPIAEIIDQTTCNNSGYNWIAATSQCFRFDDTGVYADGTGDFIEIPNDDRCETNPIESLGRFLECNGTTAVYSDGTSDSLLTSGTYEIENAERCGGNEQGRFVRCGTLPNGFTFAIYSDETGTEYTVEGDARCSAHSSGRFVRCSPPGVLGFGDPSVPVGIYDNANGVTNSLDYLFDDPRCREISNTDQGRFLKCVGPNAVYQREGSPANSSEYRTVSYDTRCYDGTKSGDVKMSYQETNHGPWLLCDGSTYSGSTFPSLSILLTGVSTGTFTVPDFRNRSPYGANSPTNVDYITNEGSATHTLTSTEMPTHNHVATDAGHSHALTMSAHSHPLTVGTHNHTFNAGSHTHSFSAGNHNHGFTPVSHTHGVPTSHNHTLSSGSHTHDYSLIQHFHGLGSHFHGVPGHNHRLFVWSESDGDAVDNDSFLKPNQVNGLGTTAVSGRGLGNYSHQFHVQYKANATNNNFPTTDGHGGFAEGGLIKVPLIDQGGTNTFGPSTSLTDGIDANRTQTTTPGGNINDTTSTTSNVTSDPASQGGTISSTNIGGTTGGETVSGSTNTVQQAVSMASIASSGTINLGNASITIATTGGGLPHNNLHPVRRVNFYIHV